MINHDVPVEPRTADKEPEFLVQRCGCENPRCDRITLAILRPVIKPLEEDPNELASVAYLPKAMISSLIRHLRDLRDE